MTDQTKHLKGIYEIVIVSMVVFTAQAFIFYDAVLSQFLLKQILGICMIIIGVLIQVSFTIYTKHTEKILYGRKTVV